MVSQQKLSKNKLKSLRPLKRRVILKMPKKPPRMQLQMPHKKRKSLKKLKNKLKLEKRKKQNKLKNSEIMPKLRPTNLKKRKLPETSSLVVTDPMEKEHLKKLPRKSQMMQKLVTQCLKALLKLQSQTNNLLLKTAKSQKARGTKNLIKSITINIRRIKKIRQLPLIQCQSPPNQHQSPPNQPYPQYSRLRRNKKLKIRRIKSSLTRPLK